MLRECVEDLLITQADREFLQAKDDNRKFLRIYVKRVFDQPSQALSAVITRLVHLWDPQVERTFPKTQSKTRWPMVRPVEPSRRVLSDEEVEAISTALQELKNQLREDVRNELEEAKAKLAGNDERIRFLSGLNKIIFDAITSGPLRTLNELTSSRDLQGIKLANSAKPSRLRNNKN